MVRQYCAPDSNLRPLDTNNLCPGHTAVHEVVTSDVLHKWVHRVGMIGQTNLADNSDIKCRCHVVSAINIAAPRELIRLPRNEGAGRIHGNPPTLSTFGASVPRPMELKDRGALVPKLRSGAPLCPALFRAI